MSDTPKPVLAWLSLALPVVPLGYLGLLLAGGGSSGMAGWGDVGRLLVLLGGSASLGLVLSGISIGRGERSLANGFAVIVHGLGLVFIGYALSQ